MNKIIQEAKKDFNKNLSFKCYVKDLIENKIEELKKEQDDLKTNKTRFKNDIKIIINLLLDRVKTFKGDEILTNKIIRNIKSIKSIIEK